ncbi:MBL fold metallo-hydrolase [Leucothrix arctica]|uniref:MBL fold metallo-hydrolase n=1 Tax=Leucothrix arctica TaxID=1481894 RepID=UPI001BA89008|nr:MBL fold metallo-hydrolase [Leucothrix arctica]
MTKNIEANIVQPLEASENYRDGKFHNATPKSKPSFGEMMYVLKRYITEKKIDPEPKNGLPIQQVTRAQLDALSDDELHLVKLGHSSILIKANGEYWLIDPVFADRASPFSFLGPKRFQPTPITIDELPPIDKVLISHNHYDHLDKAAIKKLIGKTKQFLVPMGVEGDLQKWGADKSQVTRFNWWQELKVGDTLFAFTPSQHFSGRGLGDGNTTLWGSWVIQTAGKSLYFSGDSGYFDGFKKIGEKYGPFDLTMIETGAYNEDWPDVHMFPKESVQAHIDLRGVTMLPIHNSTFDLSFHPWYEPLKRVTVEAEAQGVKLTTPIVGEVFTVDKASDGAWWEKYL